MKRKNLLITLLLFSLAAASCSSKAASPAMAVSSRGVADEMMAAEAPAMEEKASGANDSVTSTDTSRIVIKNADISLVVEDPLSAVDAINQMAVDKGGFVVNSYTYKVTSSYETQLPAANITIRVPAELLDETLAQLKAMVGDPELDILSESVSGQDVTGEVTDLESRLRNLQQAETQLLEIMDNATTTEDVMSVFQQLTSIRGDIEVLQGQIKYYRESAQLSAISINLQSKEAVAPITVAGWRPSLVLQRAIQALVDGLKFLVNALIWLVIFVAPIVLIIGLPIYLIIRASKKRSMKKKAEK
ncbi:MAG: DUF4349 domain-containing protein [Chloroflexi bacterium]|nr:DUF4349 domain-containing protein [Chloroflexota bacterium]